MRLLVFSDLHRDAGRARGVVGKSVKADVVIGAGDFGTLHFGLDRMIGVLRAIDRPAVLVAGNHEKPEALRRASTGWESATVLHGNGVEIDGVSFFGLGAAVPPTPFPWGYDLSEEAAGRLLSGCPTGAVLVVHSPPYGHLDLAMGKHLGSRAILDAIGQKRPRLVVCGHIHQCWGQEARIGGSRVLNAGPYGTLLEI